MSERDESKFFFGGRGHGRSHVAAQLAAMTILSGKPVEFMSTSPERDEQMRQRALAECEAMARLLDG